ncbi:zf-HC2 domain-containing protein [candidate division WOR-3 bacterium]|nr:zf-HC2 domain-containing protein [candidate division WOR-3 bacterium]
MKCDLRVELLSGYLDGELDKKQKAEIEKHLKECEACRKELEELRQLDEHVRTAEIEEPSREFIFNINRRVLEKVKKKPRFRLFRFSPILAPAAVALLVFVVLININRPVSFASLDERILYAEVEAKKELDIEIPKAGFAREEVYAKGVVVKEKKALTTSKVPTMAKARDVEVFDHAKKGEAGALGIEAQDEIISLTEVQELQIPRDRIVRAIVDSNGKILKVATGNTIIPERDTMLENRLQGQQLSPPLVKGKRTQLYIDLTQEKVTKN